jgi:hypothetical protein
MDAWSVGQPQPGPASAIVGASISDLPVIQIPVRLWARKTCAPFLDLKLKRAHFYSDNDDMSHIGPQTKSQPEKTGHACRAKISFGFLRKLCLEPQQNT